MTQRCCPICGAVYVRVAGVWLHAGELALRRLVGKLERLLERSGR